MDPKLDRALADSIAETLTNRGVRTTLDVAEAFGASEGLLMEFISMLVSGRRLRQVVEEQMAVRLADERTTEREIVRYVATAHSAGVSLRAENLPSLIPDRDLAEPLATLNREHILLTGDGGRWLGLHELRSDVARDYLHQFPPPTLAVTLASLVRHGDLDDACRIIEVYARIGADLESTAGAVGERLESATLRAEDGGKAAKELGKG